MPTMIEFAKVETSARLDRLAEEFRSCRDDQAPEPVHRLRVSIRRFATCLRNFPDFFPRKASRKIRKRLRDVRRAAGAVRDRDIAADLAQQAGLGSGDELNSQLHAERKGAAKRLRKMISGWPKKKFAIRWTQKLGLSEGSSEAAREGLPDRGGDSIWEPAASAEQNAAQVMPGMLTSFFARGRKVVASNPAAENLHKLRIEGKRVRYTLEFFAPCYGESAAERIKAFKRLQDHLGVINDCEVTLQLLQQKPYRDMPGAEPMRQYLIDCKAAHREDFLRQWKESFDAEGEEARWIEWLRRPIEEKIAAD